MQRFQPEPPNVFWPIIRRVQSKRIGVCVIFLPITAKAVLTLNISTLHSNVLDIYEYLIDQHNSVYSANDGRKFIHASTDEGSRVGGCFKNQKTKLQNAR